MKQKPLTWYLTSMLILASLVLGACGSTEPADSTVAPASGGGEVEITYSLWDTNQLAPYQQCATDFMAKNPNIKIGSLGFRRVKIGNLPRIARINTKNQKLVKIRVIRGKESSTC